MLLLTILWILLVAFILSVCYVVLRLYRKEIEILNETVNEKQSYIQLLEKVIAYQKTTESYLGSNGHRHVSKNDVINTTLKKNEWGSYYKIRRYKRDTIETIIITYKNYEITVKKRSYPHPIKTAV